MLFPGVLTKIFDTFNGAVLRLESYSVPPTNGLLSRNVGYSHGLVKTRYGHSAVVTQADGQITSLVNWYFVAVGAPQSVALYYAPGVGVKGWQQIGGFTGTFIPVTGAAGSTMVPAGQRLYASFYDQTGRRNTSGPYVYGWNIGADVLFAAPLSNAISAAETAPGVCTAGTRRIGYLTTTRNGYTGNLSPVSGGVFTPIDFTSTGGMNITTSITGALPSYMVGGTIQIVATTTTNLNQYYTVPGATNIATNPTNITWSISDDDLAATGTDVTAQMSLLTGLTQVSTLWTFSSRMCYAAFDSFGFPVVYISNPDDYQYITADQNAISLEGQQQVVAGCSLRGVNYLVTQFEFYSCEDNGDVPVTWTKPQKVDGSIGVLSPTCISANPSLGYAYVASERGLYLFAGGIFPALPVSYLQQSDWNRINWTRPTRVQVVDDQLNKRVIVIAPLDGATNPSHRLIWDYTEGDTSESVKYSIDDTPTYAMGAVSVIQNLTTYLQEVWYAPNANGALIRQNDGSETSAYRDIATDGTTAAAINASYKTSLTPGADEMESTLHDCHGAHFRVRGVGSFTILAASVDGTVTTTPAASPLTLSLTPNKEYLVKWFLRSEQQSITFGTNTVDQYFILSLIRAYWTPSFGQR